jgi:DNA repair exonuclease SbcCD ATPase subunit
MRYFGIRMHNFLRFGESNNSIVFDLTKAQQKEINDGTTSLDAIYDQLKVNAVNYVDQAKQNEDDNVMAGIVGITGMTAGSFDASNGSGKSTVFEAMAYASYGRIVRQTANNNKIAPAGLSVVTKLDGEYPDNLKESYVEVYFEEDGNLYRIKRGRQFTKKKTPGSAILEFECILESKVDKLSSHRGGDTKKSIEEVIVEDYDIFVNSVMFGQNDAGKFLMGSDKIKKEMIIALLKLEDVVKGCIEVIRGKKKTQNEKVNSINSRINNLQELVLKEYRTRTTEEEVEYQDSTIDDVVTLINGEITVSTEELELIKKHELDLAKEITYLENSEVLQKIKRLSEEGRKVVALKADKSAKKVEELKDWTQLVEDTEKKIQSNKLEVVKLNGLMKNTDDQKKNYMKIVSDFDEASVKDKLDKCAKASAVQSKYEKMKDDAVAKKDELHQKVMGFEVAINAKKAEVAKLEDQVKRLGDGGKFVCSECKTLVTKAHVLKKIADSKEVIKKNDELLAPLNEHFKQVKSALVSVEDRLKKIYQYSVEEGKLNVLISEHKSAKENLAHYGDRTKSLSDQISTINESDKELKVKLEEYNKKCKTIDDEFHEAIEKLHSEAMSLKQQITSLKDDAKEIEEKVGQKKSELNTLKTEKESLNKSLGSLQKEVESIIDLGKRIADEKTDLAEQSKVLQRYIILEKAFGLDGVQTRIVQKYLPLLNMYIKEYLDILSDGKMSVTMMVNDKSKVDMIISGGTADTYNMLSGGEKMIVRLAVDVGLALLSFSRTAKKPDMICLDEIFGPLDKRHTTAVFKMLKELQGRFSRVFLISHKAEIQSLVKNNIIIEKTVGNRGLSKITSINEISV